MPVEVGRHRSFAIALSGARSWQRTVDLMQLRTGPDVHVTRIHSDLVFLDIASDGYFCLIAPDRSLDGSESGLMLGSEQVDELRSAGFIANEGPGAFWWSRSDRPAWRDLPPVGRGTITLRDRARFLGALLHSGRHYMGRSLGHLLAVARHNPGAGANTADAAAIQRYAREVDIFDRLSIWLPFRGQCLFRSFLFLHFLRSIGLRADWVFGVHLFPFRAHCWLAVGDHVIGDATHRVQAYQPIMTIASGRT